MSSLRKTKDIISYFKDKPFDKEAKEYLKDHCRRYEFLFLKIDSVLAKFKNKGIKILDLGPSYQTEIFRITLPKNITIDTVGFDDSRFIKRSKDKHFEYDINHAQYKNKWLKVKNYNVIIMAELIEHLYTSPVLVLNSINSWMEKGGYLIIQTPNAVSLNRRIKMIIGRHPYDMIRENNLNPGHFREYTFQELIQAAKKSGFILKDYTITNYFKHKGLGGKLYNLLGNFLPENLRDGMTVVLQKR